jgi:hypothetical protein
MGGYAHVRVRAAFPPVLDQLAQARAMGASRLPLSFASPCQDAGSLHGLVDVAHVVIKPPRDRSHGSHGWELCPRRPPPLLLSQIRDMP